MHNENPLLERLVDFDNYGNKAMERYTLRMEAWNEIIRLRAANEALVAENKRARDHIKGEPDRFDDKNKSIIHKLDKMKKALYVSKMAFKSRDRSKLDDEAFTLVCAVLNGD